VPLNESLAEEIVCHFLESASLARSPFLHLLEQIVVNGKRCSTHASKGMHHAITMSKVAQPPESAA
jgi:hypothetical protein